MIKYLHCSLLLLILQTICNSTVFAAPVQVNPVSIKTVNLGAMNPSSPDPSGITYNSVNQQLLISDAEVEEMPAIYKGYNIFEISTSGSAIKGYTTNSFSQEPTDIAIDPTKKTLFITDDDRKRIFVIQLGADNIFGTSDDVVSSILTTTFGNNDPEGIAFGQGKLFVTDGTGAQVFIISPGANGKFDGVTPAGDDLVANFDTTIANQTDPEGIEYNHLNNTLFLVSYNNRSQVAEVSLSGTWLRNINISGAKATAPAGIAFAPSTTNTGAYSLFIVDRGQDNSTNPSENDGKLYEVILSNTAPSNTQPTPTFILPSPTIFNSYANLNINLKLHGIGTGGDNSNPSAIGTSNPLRKQRAIKLSFYNAANSLASSINGNAAYNQTLGFFEANISTNTLQSGSYTTKIEISQYLAKVVPGIITVEQGKQVNLPIVALTTGDMNSDNRLSILDYNTLIDCYADLGQPRNCVDAHKKLMADITDDGNVNQFDYNLFLRELSVQSGQ